MRMFILPVAALCLGASVLPAAATTYTYNALSQGVNSINNVGQGVGFNTSSVSFLITLATGATTIISEPPGPNVGSTTYAIALNDVGQVVGTAPNSNASNPFLLNLATGTYTSLSCPNNGARCAPTAINDGGMIAFSVDSSGFLFNPATGGYTALNGPNGTSFDRPTGINNAGQVVGDEFGTSKGFLYNSQTGAYTTLSYNLGANTFVDGINNLGQVVGYANTRLPRGSVNNGGFIYDVASGTYTALTGPDGSALTPDAINDAGQIVGTTQNGTFLLTPQIVAPVPEPASMALVCSGLVALAGIRRTFRSA